MNRNYCITSGIVFTLVALVHLWRVVLDFPLQVGAWGVPRSLSGWGAVVAAVLAVWAFKSAKPVSPPK
jgi:hypothetical protein